MAIPHQFRNMIEVMFSCFLGIACGLARNNIKLI